MAWAIVAIKPRSRSLHGRSRLGNITVRPRGNAEVGDYVLMVDIENPDHRYGRNQIFTFLYNCEVMIPRVRTTSLSIRPASEGTRKLEPGTERGRSLEGRTSHVH